MEAQKSFQSWVVCLWLLFATVEAGAGEKVSPVSVFGASKAYLNKTISVTYKVRKDGNETSGGYEVGIYLTRYKTSLHTREDSLLKKVTFSTGLGPGQIRKNTAEVVIPNYHVNGLSGKYYFYVRAGNGLAVARHKVSILRYSLKDDNETVIDHKTGLIWQRDYSSGNRDTARTYCRDLVGGWV